MHAHRSSVPSTLQPPSVVQQPPSNNAPNSLTHALSLPPPRPPDTQQQQQFIQPQAIYHNPPQVPPPTSSPYTHPFPPPAQPPQQQPQSTQPADGTTDETLPIKRKRGRPKGSKTKNRRVDGVLVPLHALGAAAASSTGTTANTTTVPAPAVQGGGDATAADHGDDDDEHDHADESMDVESPVAPDFALQPSSSSVAVVSSGLPPGTSDGAALGLGIGLDVPGPSSSTRAGMSSDIRATSHPAPASSSVGVGAPSTGAATSPTSTTTIKDFYDFQWRVISLCSVFYESAGDLVRATDPAVLAQSFQLGSRADPMTLLHHAKEFCDFFLANPERLARGPLPPPIPTSLFPTSSAPPSQPVPTPPITTYPVPSRPDIHPGPSSSSFGQRRPSQQFYPTPISPTASSSNPYLASIYNRPPVSAPTSTTPATHSPQQPQQPKQTASSLSGAVPITPSHPPVLPPHISITNNPYLPANTLAQTHPIPPPTYVAPVSASAAKSIPQSTHGAWSDEETERLKTLAEQSRSRTHNGDIDWDWTVDMFGETRTRHQILIKATNLGLKQTSTHPSRLRKRLSMTNTQDGSPSVPPASSTTPVSHQVETIRETMLGGSGGSRSSQGSNPSPPVGASATSMQHPQSQAPGTSQQAPGMSPSASMTSTPTLPHSDQHPHQVQHLPPPHAPPGHHRRPSSSASFQPSPAMGTSTALRPSQGVLASPTPGQAQGPGPQGYMQPPPHPTGRSASYSFPQQSMPQQQSSSQGTPRQTSQVSMPRFLMSPQVQQQPRSVSHSGAVPQPTPPQSSTTPQHHGLSLPGIPQSPYSQQAQPSGAASYQGRPPQNTPPEHQLALPRQPNPQSHMPPPPGGQRAQSQYQQPPIAPQGQYAPPDYTRPPAQQMRQSSFSSGRPPSQTGHPPPPPSQRPPPPPHGQNSGNGSAGTYR